MKRSLKNIIMIAIIISLGICSYFTMKGTNSNQTTNKGEIQQAQGTPPGNSNNMETSPEKPTGDTNSNNTGTPPEMPTGNTNASNMGTPPNQAQNGTQNPNSQTKIKTNKIIILGIEGLAIAILITYIALSKFNKLTLKETLKSTETKIIFIAITILLTTILTIGQIYIAQNIINKTNNTENTQMMPQEINNSSQTAEATGEKTITGETETLKEEYTTTDSDKSAILVENGGNATIEGATISKTGGDSTNTENSEFYGINSGILVTQNSTATIKNATIETNAKGSNAVFSTGTDSKIYINDSKINTTGSSSSRGLDATYGGYIEAENVEITTQGGSCATLATDRGEGTGTFTATNSNLSIQANSKYYKTAPMFFITNTDAIINLKNCQLTYGSNTLISNKGTTEWGTTGTNGGNLTLNAENQTLKGNIEIDNISTLKMNLTNSHRSE